MRDSQQVIQQHHQPMPQFQDPTQVFMNTAPFPGVTGAASGFTIGLDTSAPVVPQAGMMRGYFFRD